MIKHLVTPVVIKHLVTPVVIKQVVTPAVIHRIDVRTPHTGDGAATVPDMGRMRVAVCALAVGGLTLLAACSDDAPEPPDAPSTAAPSSPSPSPSSPPETEAVATPPPLPPEATTPDAAGAAAFVRHWFDLVNYAYATGDTRPVAAASDPTCETCKGFIDSIERQYSSGGSMAGGEISVIDAVAPEPSSDAPSLVTSRYEQEAIQAVSAEGEVEAETPAQGSTTIAFYVSPIADGWSAFEIGGQAS